MTLIKIDHTEYGLEEKKAQDISNMFKPMLDEMEALEVQYNEVLSREIEPETIQMAHDLRLAYVKVRTGTDKIHKELKAFYLQGGRFVDGWKNAQRMASVGNEEKLKAIEDHFVNIEKERVATLYTARRAILWNYTEFIPNELGEMDEPVWDNYLAGTKHTHQETIKAEDKIHKERLEEARKEQEKNRKARQDVDRLRKERKQNEREQEEKDRIQAEKLKRERMENERLLKEAREKEEAEQSRIKAEEDKIQADLKKGDMEKTLDLIGDLQRVHDYYTFKSKENQAMWSRAQGLIRGIIQAIGE